MSGLLVYSQHHAHAWARCVPCRSARDAEWVQSVQHAAPHGGVTLPACIWLCGSPWCARAGPWARRAGYEPREGTCGGSWPQGAPVSS
eukprot:scaffold738_cov201-Isochrysis_galbana.AAC.2